MAPFLLLALSLAGCQSQETEPIAVTPMPSGADEKVKSLQSDFVQAIQQGKVPTQLMTSALQAKLGKIDDWKKANYAPVLSGTKWDVESVSGAAKGKKMVSHARFNLGEDVYRTNFVFIQDKDGWTLDEVLPPTKGGLARQAMSGGVSTAP